MSVIMHCGAREASREEINQIDVPPVRYNEKGHVTYQPIAHTTLLGHVESELAALDIRVANDRHFLNRDGNHYFAQLELEGPHQDYCSFVGVRNSHLADMAAGMALGHKVRICDNLMFSAEVVINRRHSRFIHRDIPGLVNHGVAQLLHVEKNQEARIEHYKDYGMRLWEAEHAFIRCLELGAIGRAPRLAWDQWRNREELRWGEEPTAWKFQNVITNGWTSAPTSPLLVTKSRKLATILDQVTGFEPTPPPADEAENDDVTIDVDPALLAA